MCGWNASVCGKKMMESLVTLAPSCWATLLSIVPIVDPIKSVLIWTLTFLQSNRNRTYFLSHVFLGSFLEMVSVFVLIWLTLSCFNQTFWPKGAPITRICLVGLFIFNSLRTFCLWLFNSITVVTAELIPAQMLVKTLQSAVGPENERTRECRLTRTLWCSVNDGVRWVRQNSHWWMRGASQRRTSF